MPEEGINPIEFPEVARAAWHWFMKLDAKRQPAMAGLSPISESEIGWFFRNRSITPDGWEFDAIDALDRLAIEFANQED